MRRFVLALTLLVPMLLASCAARPGLAEHVVVITVDGFPAWLLDDPKAPIPAIRELMRLGAAAPSVRVINPSITWPTHTAIVTGCRADRHGVLVNGLVVRQGPNLPVKVEPSHDRAELVKVPTVYDLVHEAGLATADINWPCTRSAGTLDDSLSDAPLAIQYATPRLRQELIDAGILVDATENSFWRTSPAGRDALWTDAACHVLGARKPALLLFHLLNVDALHHTYGPGSMASYTALAYADTCVRRLLDALDQAGIRNSTTVILMADHGFTATPKTLRPNALLRKAGLLTANPAGKIDSCRVHVLAEGGIGMVYLTADKPSDELRQVRDLLAGKEGLADILGPEHYAAHHLPLPADNPQMPDMILSAKDGYGFSDSAAGDDLVVNSYDTHASLGTHGYLVGLVKMNVPLILSGAGVRRGARLQTAEIIDVAPTVARLLGLEMPSVQGRVLTELLDVPAPTGR